MDWIQLTKNMVQQLIFPNIVLFIFQNTTFRRLDSSGKTYSVGSNR
jgi:hypothetical protein